jgi:hypothetical protein
LTDLLDLETLGRSFENRRSHGGEFAGFGRRKSSESWVSVQVSKSRRPLTGGRMGVLQVIDRAEGCGLPHKLQLHMRIGTRIGHRETLF